MHEADLIFEKEANRKHLAKTSKDIRAKNLTENFDHASDMKLMRGPFYDLISKDGPQEDNFVNCGVRDLIDSANQEGLRILIVGKPRVGKTTLTKRLCETLDLVRINADVWIEQLFAKIKDREENPPEESEPEENDDAGSQVAEKPPKKWLTDLEETVHAKLMAGGTASQDEVE